MWKQLKGSEEAGWDVLVKKTLTQSEAGPFTHLFGFCHHTMAHSPVQTGF